MFKLLAWLAALWFAAPTLAVIAITLRVTFFPEPERTEPAPTERHATLDELLSE